MLAKNSKNESSGSSDDDSSDEKYDMSNKMVLMADALHESSPGPPLEALLLSLCQPSLEASAVDNALRLLPSLATTVDNGLLAALLTSRPGSLLTAIRHLLTTHHIQATETTRKVLTCVLTFTAGVLDDPSPGTQLVVFHAGVILTHKSSATGFSLTEDLASLCKADDPSDLSCSAVRCLAALVSKKCCLVLVPSHLPRLAHLINSSDGGVASAAVKVVHCIATTETSREALTKAGTGAGVLLPALSQLLQSEKNNSRLTPKNLSLVLGAVRSLFYLLNPGALSQALIAEMTASLSSLKELGGGHEKLIDSITGQRLMLPQHRNVRQFPTIDTRDRIRVLEKEFVKHGPVAIDSLQCSTDSTGRLPTVHPKHAHVSWFGAECSDESTSGEESKDSLRVANQSKKDVLGAILTFFAMIVTFAIFKQH